MGQHWQALQPQLSDGSAVDRFEIGIAQARLRKPRQETCHCDRDRRAPEDIADAVLFMMKNGFVTGITLTVDGGRMLI